MYIIVYCDDCMIDSPYSLDPDCEGAITLSDDGPVALFASRKAARNAIRISTAYAKLLDAQGKAANTDFIDAKQCIKIRKVEHYIDNSKD